MTKQVVADLGIQLGVCAVGSSEAAQLAFDYCSIIDMVKEEQRGGKGGRCWAEVNTVIESNLLHSSGGISVCKELVLAEYPMSLRCSLSCPDVARC